MPYPPSLRLRTPCVILLIAFFAALPAFGMALLPQEAAIANYMATNSGQGRPQLILDPLIETVARARAQDMARRGYFAHVNPDGHAANYLLRQAGYQLPTWWGNDPAANYVESIAAGYSDAGSTWNAWMNSPEHKTHLLAENSFYATETHYGVGFYSDPSSPYIYYWVVITAPPQPALPLEITTPAATETVTTGSAALAGTTTPGSNAATVHYRVENTSGTGAWQTAAGTAHWTGEAANLTPGVNVVRAQSLDASGNPIFQAARTIVYEVPSPLTVTVSGSGSVTAGFAGTTTRYLGLSYALRAAPAPGSIFTGWTGSVSSSAAMIAFTMQAGTQVQANFIPNPFKTVSGNYFGLLTSGSNAPAGFFHATLAATGILSGRLQWDGAGYAFTGRLDTNGVAAITIPRPGSTPLTLTFQADLSGASQQLTGSLTDGAASIVVSADRATFNLRSNPSAQAGRYTVILSPTTNGDAAQTPQGNGFAILLVRKSGVASLSGRMGDGTPFIRSAMVTENGTLPLWFVPASEAAGSSVSGLLAFRPTTVSDVDGTLVWTKAPNHNDPFYPAGFTTQLPAIGSLYAAPRPGLNSLAAGNASIEVGDGNLSAPVDVPVAIGANHTGTMTTPGTPHLTFTINPLSGIVTGTFTMPNGNLVRGFCGIVLQKQNAAFGYFRGVNQAGYFTLSPAS